MILGVTPLTFIHVLLSLIGILSGVVVLFGLLESKRLDGWAAVFLTTTVLTSATGYLFPFHRLLPSHIIGAVSLVALAVAIVARYSKNLTGSWGPTYVISAMIAFYLNVFVLIFQALLKVPALKAAAPTQSEPPFLSAQVVVMILFILLTVRATRRFRAESLSAA
jgi:hypothetical protein